MKKIYYCAYCGEVSDRGCIQKCRSCTKADVEADADDEDYR